MIKTVYLVYSEVNKRLHFQSLAIERACLHYQYCGTHWYLLVPPLSLELSLKIFIEPTLTTILFVILNPLLLGSYKLL